MASLGMLLGAAAMERNGHTFIGVDLASPDIEPAPPAKAPPPTVAREPWWRHEEALSAAEERRARRNAKRASIAARQGAKT